MTALDRRLDKRNAVLRYGPENAGAPTLVVDRTHPFFFDHPLDHIPGLLLLEGAVQAAQDVAAVPCFVEEIYARFVKFALFEAPVTLEVSQQQDGARHRVEVTLVQSGRVRARITVGLAPVCAPRTTVAPRDDLRPCAGDLLNKRRAENVLITTPVIDGETVGAALLPISPDCLLADSESTVHPLYLLEAFMQLQRFLNATRDGAARVRDILTGIRITQEAPLCGVGDVTLRGGLAMRTRADGQVARGADLLIGERPFGHCSIETARLQSRVKLHSSRG
ncbi:AfsA-related hotdog domain-containing protein [uncultured Roseobacter sp.]|uniref:AfsA-related hotdog domain-containing protein n=1 Tax=uncultured Roseobacter sp. TaxID=114847 RepID=UPI0026233C50|nr:AfsA-related hotdog domain-containing protein [uncultured Roseobacter sp.]